MQRVQKLQNFAAKVAAGDYNRCDRATPVIQELQWIKMKEIGKFDQCVMVYKVKLGSQRVTLVLISVTSALEPVEGRSPLPRDQSDNRVTTVYLPRLRGHSSLPDVAYLLTARGTGAWGYRKNSRKFSTSARDRTRDLSIVSRVCYRCTTEPCIK